MKKFVVYVFLLISAASINICAGQGTKYVYTVAGGGTSTTSGTPALSFDFSGSRTLWVDDAENIYVNSDRNIWVINNATGIVATIAGPGPSSSTYSGDGGPATAAAIKAWGMYANMNNVAFAGGPSGSARRINLATGIISAVVTPYSLSFPASVFEDAANNVYISDAGVILRVDAITGVITHVAGNGTVGYSGDGGPATSALIAGGYSHNAGMAIDGGGNFYFADQQNNVIRKVDAGSHIIHTVAGNGTSGYSGDGGPATNAKLSGPGSIAIDVYGNLLIGDNNRIRMVNGVTGIISTVAGGGTSTTDGAAALSSNISGATFCLDRIGNVFVLTGSKVKKITNFYPAVGGGAAMGSDSFILSVNKQCSGPQLFITTPHYIAGRTMKTYFGDGTFDSSLITPGYISGGGLAVSHSYPVTGTYMIRQVLYNGSAIVDSFSFSYDYDYCRTLPLKVFYDANSNGNRDLGEPYSSFPSLAVIDSNGIVKDTLSVTSGFTYEAHGSPGDIYKFRIVPSVPGTIITTSPGAGYITDTLSTITTYPVKTFGVNCVSGASFDFSIRKRTRTNLHRQSADIYVSNLDCAPASATVTAQFSPKFTHIVATSPAPFTMSGNTITWNLSGLFTFGPPVHLCYVARRGSDLTPGDTANALYQVTPVAGDHDVSNNTLIFVDTALASHDPNEISVSPDGCLPPGSTQLEYSINFENTGNDTAHNIYVLDTISGNLDAQTIRIVLASAPMDISIIKSGSFNIVKFNFQNINLLDSSHHGECDGLVIFTIKTKSGLLDGTAIDNRAGIYFDDNEVVMTNTAENIKGCPAQVYAPVISSLGEVLIYPNPTNDELTIKTDKDAFSSFAIMNSVGQAVNTGAIANVLTKVSVKTLPAGLYYVMLRGAGGSVVRKVVKD